jgi:hypothetical protein
MTINITVYTISGKSQEFSVVSNKAIRDIKTQIIKNHKYYVGPNDDTEIKLLYKGIELEEYKSLDNYSITDKSTIQIINKTKPISIKRISESLPNNYNTSIFESYAPSPLDNGSDFLSKISKSNSPHNNYLEALDQNNNIIKILGNITHQLDSVLNRLTNLETKVENINKNIQQK